MFSFHLILTTQNLICVKEFLKKNGTASTLPGIDSKRVFNRFLPGVVFLPI